MGLLFDGISHFEKSNSASLNPTNITICGWMKVGADISQSYLMHKAFTSHSDPYYQYSIALSSIYIDFQISVNGNYKEIFTSNATPRFATGDIVFMCGTFDGHYMKIYCWKNGVRDTQAPIGDTGDLNGTIPSYNTPLYFNRAPGITSSIHDPLIWDNRIYSRALSEAEVQTIFFSKGSDKIINGLVGRWLMLDKTEDSVATGAGSVIDISGNGNNGTPISSPVYKASPLKLKRSNRS